MKGESIFLIRTQVEMAGEDTLLSVAMNDELIPFLICRKSSREPSEAEVEEAVEALRELCGTGMESLRLYVEEIDRIYETCQEYQNNVRDLYVSLLQEAAVGLLCPWRVAGMCGWQGGGACMHYGTGKSGPVL